MIHMKCQTVFSLKKKIKLSAAVAVISAISVNKTENDAFYHLCIYIIGRLFYFITTTVKISVIFKS